MMMVMRMWTLVWIDFQIHSAGSPSKKDHLDNIFFSGRKKSHQYKTFSEFGKGGDTWTPWGYFVCFGTFFWFYFLVCVLFNPFPHLRDDVTKKFDSAESYPSLAKWRNIIWLTGSFSQWTWSHMTLESLSRDVYTCPAAFVFFAQSLLSPLLACPLEPKSVPEARCPLPPSPPSSSPSSSPCTSW